MASNTQFPLTFPTRFGHSMPATAATDPVDTIYDILEGAPETVLINGEEKTVWSEGKPDVEKLWHTTPKSAFNNQDPTVYIYTTLDPDFEDFDAEGSARIENHQVEIDVFTFDESLTMTITREVKALLEEYMRDNYAKTEYQYIKPELTQDNRNVNNPRNTEPYWAKVQCELMAKRTVGL